MQFKKNHLIFGIYIFISLHTENSTHQSRVTSYLLLCRYKGCVKECIPLQRQEHVVVRRDCAFAWLTVAHMCLSVLLCWKGRESDGRNVRHACVRYIAGSSDVFLSAHKRSELYIVRVKRHLSKHPISISAATQRNTKECARLQLDLFY